MHCSRVEQGPGSAAAVLSHPGQVIGRVKVTYKLGHLGWGDLGDLQGSDWIRL